MLALIYGHPLSVLARFAGGQCVVGRSGQLRNGGRDPAGYWPLIHALIWSVHGVHFASGMPVAADVPIGAAIKSTASASRPVAPMAAVNMPEPARLERSARKSCQLCIFDLGCTGRDVLR